jgi:hypothetical protein
VPLRRDLLFYRTFLYTTLKFLIKISLNKKFFPYLKGPRKGVSLHVHPYGNRHPYPEPYLAYSSGSPVKNPSLKVLLIELPLREMPHS